MVFLNFFNEILDVKYLIIIANMKMIFNDFKIDKYFKTFK